MLHAAYRMEDSMTAGKKGRLLSAATLAMILCLVIVMPASVGATPLDPFEFKPFGDDSVILTVSITEITALTGTDYQYDYYAAATTANLYQFSIGSVDVDTKEIYVVKEADLGPDATVPQSRITSNSVLLYFLPTGLGAGVDYEFSITYDEFVESQYITVRTTGTGGSTKTIAARYVPTDPGSPIPEPMTLLLLGCGVAGLGLLGRKRR